MAVLDVRRPITDAEIDVLCRQPNVNRKAVTGFLKDVNEELNDTVTHHLAQLRTEQSVFKLNTETFKAIRRGIYITQSEQLHLERMTMAGAATKNKPAKNTPTPDAPVQNQPPMSPPEPCLCGCGNVPGRGSNFLPGHDAKLKGYLRRGEVSPDQISPEAKERLISRTSTWEQYFLTPAQGGVAGLGNAKPSGKKPAASTEDPAVDDVEDEDDSDEEDVEEEDADEEVEDDDFEDEDEEDDEEEEEDE